MNVAPDSTIPGIDEFHGDRSIGCVISQLTNLHQICKSIYQVGLVHNQMKGVVACCLMN